MQRILFFLLQLTRQSKKRLYALARQCKIVGAKPRFERGAPLPKRQGRRGRTIWQSRSKQMVSFLTGGLIAFGSLSAASAESDACGKEIQVIDQQVQKLEKQKQVHQDLARKYQKLGDEWQYSTGNIQDAYVNWNRADQERRKAIDLQHQVDLLLQRKQRIIQFYPELYQP